MRFLTNHSFYNPAIFRKNGQAIWLIHTGMEIADFIRTWPCLFHMTAALTLLPPVSICDILHNLSTVKQGSKHE
jgi:hypothetical protein